ncbi:MAG: hypothetical protein M1833_000171 [Piccolia ochrophora]|nr:MAG: hypothetical protein M1833_000171 [Piccolia ochrophora]
MPSHIPTSFASAAAGSGSQDGMGTGRGPNREGSASGDWSRSRPNGLGTTTFRRPSHTTATNQSSHHQSGSQNYSSSPSHPSQSSFSRQNHTADHRYSKDLLLNVYKAQKDAGELGKNLSELFVSGWEPGKSNGAGSASWNRRDDLNKDSNGASGPDLCWEDNGNVDPLALFEMDETEKEVFLSSVNSPIKPPLQNTNKDQNAAGSAPSGRKSSVSQGQSNAFGSSSPSSARPPNRRRDTGDSSSQLGNALPTPPTGGKGLRDDAVAPTPPSLLLRRKTDTRDNSLPLNQTQREPGLRDGQEGVSLLPGLQRRTSTGPLSASGNTPASPWGGGSGFSPMGSFGNFGLAESGGTPTTPAEKKPSLGNVRGGSRWSKFMGKDNPDEPIAEKSSTGNLERLAESEGEKSQDWRSARATRPLSNETDPFGDDESRAANVAVTDNIGTSSAQQQNQSSSETASRQFSRENFKFADVGMSSNVPGLHDPAQERSRQSGRHHSYNSSGGAHEPLSPTETNPYQSPVAEKAGSDEVDTDDSEMRTQHHPGLTGMSSDQPGGMYGNILTGVPNGFPTSAGDRSQSSSAGPARNFPNLGSIGALGGLGGWPTSAGPAGMTDRDRLAFAGGQNNPVYSPLGDVQSPGLAGLGGGIFGNSNGPGQIGSLGGAKGSKLGSLFPPAMQSQMFGDTGKQGQGANLGESRDGQHQDIGLDGHGRAGLEGGAPGYTSVRETDSPLRSGRGAFEDAFLKGLEGSLNTRVSDTPFGPIDAPMTAFGSASFTTPTSAHPNKVGQPPLQSQSSQSNLSQSGQQQTPTGGSNVSQSQQQQRTMVMPDRMRWIYRDPQGSTQGPWSGLEMHDWFKAGFFSAELLVKKVEDPDFEPLGQLIRRIGNSREPFLVPQNGIPYGPPTGQSTPQWTPGTAAPGTTQPAHGGGSVQPPFAGAFPSFGTTLTAEQQNALERRKQEEQYLMARQKEYLAQQQVIQKQMHQMQGGIHPQQLHHHSSAHSLHSQPSFGSVTSPGSYHQTPPQAPIQPPQSVPGFFDTQSRPNVAVGTGENAGSGVPRDDEIAALLARQSINREGQSAFGGPSQFGQQQQDTPTHQQQVASVIAQRMQLQREQAQQDQMSLSGLDEQKSNERLQQFNDLRTMRDNDFSAQRPEGLIAKPIGPPPGQYAMDQQAQQQYQHRASLQIEDLIGNAQKPSSNNDIKFAGDEPEILSLTQQVQKAASEKPSPVHVSHQEAAWSRGDRAGLPHAFPPPPQSSSPLPAPAAQRNRQNLPDALTVESSSPQTPSSETPVTAASIAPWAKESSTEGSKGPSLREIQEAEARKAARAEEAASAARRAQLESERVNVGAAPAPGLPSSSTWASSGSPVNPAQSVSSVWAKASAAKSSSTQGGTGMKKTLSQIQKEEEARKQKAAAILSAGSPTTGVSATTVGASAGKRYADLASKAIVAQPPQAGGAWTTVGASGKPKAPLAAVPGPPPGLRAPSSTAAGTANPAIKTRPGLTSSRSSALGGMTTNQSIASDEFTKWARSTLAKGLNSNINVDDFVQQLLIFPPEAELISESVYQNSQTMDSRRFAEEYVRRRKLADKGIVESSSSAASSAFSTVGATDGNKNGGGWSEVAKKGPAPSKDATDASSAFKVVAAKKKGRK